MQVQYRVDGLANLFMKAACSIRATSAPQTGHPEGSQLSDPFDSKVLHIAVNLGRTDLFDLALGRLVGGVRRIVNEVALLAVFQRSLEEQVPSRLPATRAHSAPAHTTLSHSL